MKKITTILLISIFSILVINGCWLEKKGEEIEEMDTEELLEEIAEEEEIVTDEVIESSIDALKEVVADENADSSSCEAIADPDLKQSCEQKFVYEEAVKKQDEAMCEELLNEYDRDKCIEEIDK